MKLSVITINRNNAAGLRNTMKSVFAQTYRDFEFVVVDGASTDRSVEVIQEFDSKIKDEILETRGLRLRWISEPDSGIYNAMNKGIKCANGEYCLFLNSGDYLIAPDVLESVFALQLDVDIINARCNVSDKGKVIWTSPYLPNITLKDVYFAGIPHQSTFIRRNLFEKYGLYREDFSYNSDIDFWYKAIVLGDVTTRGLELVTTDYNLDGQSTRNGQTAAYKKEITEILSQGFLPKVMPDYDTWRIERLIIGKYDWIEQHRGLQRCLSFLNKIYKHI